MRPVRRFVVAERSMSPAIVPGQTLLAVPVRRARRGVVLCLPEPGAPGAWLVKRVVGLPGEVVTVRDGDVHLDGVRFADPWTVDDTEPDGEWVVPRGHVFVLSDARHRSRADSRTYGPVPVRGAYRVLRLGSPDQAGGSRSVRPPR